MRNAAHTRCRRKRQVIIADCMNANGRPGRLNRTILWFVVRVSLYTAYGIATTTMSAHATEAGIRIFNVQVVPERNITLPKRNEDFTATLATVPYIVEDVSNSEHLKWGHTLVVLDFASTSPKNHICLVAEAFSQRVRQLNIDAVVVAAGQSPKLTYDPALGPGVDSVRLIVGGSLDQLTHACEQTALDRPSAPMQRLNGFDSIVTFQAIQGLYDLVDGPIRIFWLAEDFGWFDYRGNTSCDRPDPCIQSIRNAAFERLENSSEAGITVFPIVFDSDKNNRSQRAKSSQTRSATFFARYMGGFATWTSDKPGDTLTQLLSDTERGCTLRLRGPVQIRKERTASVRALQIRAKTGAGQFSWERPYIVNAPDGLVHGDPNLASFAPRLTWPSTDLDLKLGCIVPNSAEQGNGLQIMVPGATLSPKIGEVTVQINYMSDRSPILRQRVSLKRSNDGTVTVCVPLLRFSAGVRFQVIAMDPSIHWIAMKDITLTSP